MSSIAPACSSWDPPACVVFAPHAKTVGRSGVLAGCYLSLSPTYKPSCSLSSLSLVSSQSPKLLSPYLAADLSLPASLSQSLSSQPPFRNPSPPIPNIIRGDICSLSLLSHSILHSSSPTYSFLFSFYLPVISHSRAEAAMDPTRRFVKDVKRVVIKVCLEITRMDFFVFHYCP